VVDVGLPIGIKWIQLLQLWEGVMNKSLKILFACFSAMLLLENCQKQVQVARFIEDGVEVIINHLEPYTIRGEPTSFHLEEEFTVDTENDEIAETGLMDIGGFDIDSERKIYIFPDRSGDENLVYKFDQEGNFIKAFGKRGEGPREIARCGYMYITDKDEIPILGVFPHKLVIFDKEGTYLHETHLKVEEYCLGLPAFFPLENGNYLKHAGCFEPSTNHAFEKLQLFNSNFTEIKELDRCDYGLKGALAMKEELTPRVFIWRVLNERIFVGHENRGYEILIYDLAGNLLKKIRKEYTPADVPDEMKEENRRLLTSDNFVLTDEMPPFHYFFLDDVGRLYVKTFEKDANKDEYFHDIFNSDGVFILRKSMPGYARWTYPGNSVNRAKAKNHRFFCIREKESGFKELVVYKMRWD